MILHKSQAIFSYQHFKPAPHMHPKSTYATIPFFYHHDQQLAISQVVERCLNMPLHQKLLSEDDVRVFTQIQKGNFQILRVYLRLLKKMENIERDFFITFKTVETPNDVESTLLKSIIQTGYSNIGYGLGFNKSGVKKIWIAPYGHQPEFLKSLSNNYKPFISQTGNLGIPHYVGYFQDSKKHQIYYFLGKDAPYLNPKLTSLNPDYYGYSQTYDASWNQTKENHYAIGVPYHHFKNDEDFELPLVEHLNVSYRRQTDMSSESAVSYLLGSFSDVNFD